MTTAHEIDGCAVTPNARAEAEKETAQPVRWSVPMALFACVLLAFFDKISIAALFSDTGFQRALGIDFDPTRLGLLMTAFLLSYGLSSTLLSGIGDRISPKKLLLGMMCVWCVLMIMMGFTHSYSGMMTLRILLGIAEGPLFPLAFSIVRHAFPQRLQARATMLWLLGTPIGAAVGFPVTLYILNHAGWQATFFVMAALTLPVILWVWLGLRHVAEPPRAVARTAQGQAGERREERRQLLRQPHFWLICLFNITFLTYLWGMNGWLPSYLIDGKGIHLEHASYLSSLPFIAMLLGEVIGAWFSDRVNRRALSCFISMLGAGAGLLMVLHLSNTYAVIAAMAFSTFMWGAGAPNIFALLAKATSRQVSATAGGIFNGLGNFAGALAPVVMGVLIATFHDMDTGLMFLTAVAAVGCLMLLPLLKHY
ncbi:MFS transporter [Enterobacillus tribolii]|uniref:Sugar phosphate permease n=1 Tax=Enterobacillus tribolii TaxID=1487935 RepID=A0A370QGB7_9GAMM|nr:MFS transporter [Enterobacillus tribolii]RDK87414.1 sugar phosphate permease [Enterobacillus tribolii]